MKSVLLCTKEPASAAVIRDCLQPEYRVETAPDRGAALDRFRRKRYDFLFIDTRLLAERTPEGPPDPAEGPADATAPTDWRARLQAFRQLHPAEIIVMAAPESIREAVNAVKAGASNYLTHPVNPDEVKYVTESLLAAEKIQYELDYLRDKFWETDAHEVVRTNSPVMKKVYDKVKSVAATNTTVLLTGETGTGKGVLAHLIHRHSPRCSKQFIGVHCGTIPDTLLESELFGHEKGAFTGAHRRKLGKFEIAGGGSLFLDEIGTIPPPAQITLLQVLQDRTFSRVGGEEILRADVRIIAATNDDLRKMSDAGQFRSDLFYRLNVFPIELPPLRSRAEDIPLLVDSFLRRLNRLYQKGIRAADPDVMAAFANYSWPGNIRELENLIERAYILEETELLTPDSFPGELFDFGAGNAKVAVDTTLPFGEFRRVGLENLEAAYLREVLSAHRGSINRAAVAAGITTRYLHKLMTKYGIAKESFKIK